MSFEFFLTRELGWRSVEAMRLGMSEDEFLLWATYYRYEARERKWARQKQAANARARRLAAGGK